MKEARGTRMALSRALANPMPHRVVDDAMQHSPTAMTFRRITAATLAAIPIALVLAALYTPPLDLGIEVDAADLDEQLRSRND